MDNMYKIGQEVYVKATIKKIQSKDGELQYVIAKDMTSDSDLFDSITVKEQDIKSVDDLQATH